MARHNFGGTMADWAFTFNTDGSVAQAAGAVLTFWDSLSGGNQYLAAPMPGGVDDGTGLLDGTGTPISSVTCDGNGEIPDSLQGPDGIYVMAADGSGSGSGPRRWITANDMGDDLTTLLGDVAAIPALSSAPIYVTYDAVTGAYPARPQVSVLVWWVGPVQPLGGAPGDVWLNTSGTGGGTSGGPGGSAVTFTDSTGAIWLPVVSTAGVLASQCWPVLQDQAYGEITDQAGGLLV